MGPLNRSALTLRGAASSRDDIPAKNSGADSASLELTHTVPRYMAGSGVDALFVLYLTAPMVSPVRSKR